MVVLTSSGITMNGMKGGGGADAMEGGTTKGEGVSGGGGVEWWLCVVVRVAGGLAVVVAARCGGTGVVRDRAKGYFISISAVSVSSEICVGLAPCPELRGALKRPPRDPRSRTRVAGTCAGTPRSSNHDIP